MLVQWGIFVYIVSAVLAGEPCAFGGSVYNEGFQCISNITSTLQEDEDPFGVPKYLCSAVGRPAFDCIHTSLTTCPDLQSFIAPLVNPYLTVIANETVTTILESGTQSYCDELACTLQFYSCFGSDVASVRFGNPCDSGDGQQRFHCAVNALHTCTNMFYKAQIHLAFSNLIQLFPEIQPELDKVLNGQSIVPFCKGLNCLTNNTCSKTFNDHLQQIAAQFPSGIAALSDLMPFMCGQGKVYLDCIEAHVQECSSTYANASLQKQMSRSRPFLNNYRTFITGSCTSTKYQSFVTEKACVKQQLVGAKFDTCYNDVQKANPNFNISETVSCKAYLAFDNCLQSVGKTCSNDVIPVLNDGIKYIIHAKLPEGCKDDTSSAGILSASWCIMIILIWAEIIR